MEKRVCAACRKHFRPQPQVPRQAYCRDAACQRERRRRWQEAKRQGDPDYQENQRHAQHAWCVRNPDYWREYRETHPDYREDNRQQQRARRRGEARPGVAKMDVSAPTQALKSGLYRIVPLPGSGVAKMDAWTAEITLISSLSATVCGRCKERM